MASSLVSVRNLRLSHVPLASNDVPVVGVILATAIIVPGAIVIVFFIFKAASS